MENNSQYQNQFNQQNNNQYQEMNQQMNQSNQQSNNKKRRNMYIAGPLILLIALVGVTYAFFNYTRTGLANNIGTGRIYFNSTQGNTLYLTNLFPMASSEVLNGNIDSITINIVGDTTYNNGQEFLISLVDVNNTITSGSTEKNIPVNYVATYAPTAVATGEDPNNIGTSSNDYFNDRGSTTAVYKLNTTGEVTEGKQVLIGYIPADVPINGTLTIKAYLDGSNIAISDTYDETSPETDYNGTTTEWVNGRTVLTTNEWNSLQNTPISFKIKAESNEGIWVEEKLTGVERVQRAITAKMNAQTNSCNPVFIDDVGTANDASDDITYFSGTNDCVDMNYVWYSGKLWRITTIYPDGAMKLVTEDNITSIFWGSSVEYDGSWVYQWLNEDFYDTLVNPNSIIDSTSTWNYSEDGNSTPVRPETIATQKTKVAPVGLLNAYEYYNAYRNANTSTNYLNIGYYWWLITPYSTSNVRVGNYNGNLGNSSPSSFALGVRPSINLKFGLEFTGDGSKSNPYKIVGDKEDAVNNTTLLSSRSVGEYVKFDNDLYRIVDTNGGTTKLTRVDYLRDSGTVINKYFANIVYFGKSTNTQNDTYWDYYLNNTWYNSISSDYKSMLVDGTYYLGLYQKNTNYKATICADANLNSVTTTNCTKYTSGDANKTFTGKVGLPRAGEMFSSQLGSGYSTSNYMWTITPYSTSYVHHVGNYGDLNYSRPSSLAYGVRPSINLKSGIKITGGTGYVGGDVNSPFEISE